MKKIQIIIIITALVLTLGCVGTIAVLYFATDTFKSDQEMFYKYASQIDLKEFLDLESYNTYSKRLENEGYSSEGAFTFELAQDEQVISESIVYNGYTDPVNKTANYDISINKDDEELLALNYLNKQDFYGVLFKDVVNQYIVIENNNLKEFASKMGVSDTSEIPNKIEIPEEINNINYEEINTILNKYLNIAMETIPEDNYSKIKKGNVSIGDEILEVDGYQIKLRVNDVRNILTKIIENARNDEEIFELLNSEDITFEEYQESFDEFLEQLSEDVPSEDNIVFITINVYKQGKDTVKLSVNQSIEDGENIEIAIEKTPKSLELKFLITEQYGDTEDRFSIIISKTVNSDKQENFKIVISQVSDEEETQLLNINISRNGAPTSNRVEFSMAVTAEIEEIKIVLDIESVTDFSGQPLEGDFTGGNHLVINGLSSEQITNLFTNLGKVLGEKLKDEMFVMLITRTMNVNSNLYDLAEQAEQATQDALEQENLLNSGMIEADGQTYIVDEYFNNL